MWSIVVFLVYASGVTFLVSWRFVIALALLSKELSGTYVDLERNILLLQPKAVHCFASVPLLVSAAVSCVPHANPFQNPYHISLKHVRVFCFTLHCSRTVLYLSFGLCDCMNCSLVLLSISPKWLCFLFLRAAKQPTVVYSHGIPSCMSKQAAYFPYRPTDRWVVVRAPGMVFPLSCLLWVRNDIRVSSPFCSEFNRPPLFDLSYVNKTMCWRDVGVFVLQLNVLKLDKYYCVCWDGTAGCCRRQLVYRAISAVCLCLFGGAVW